MTSDSVRKAAGERRVAGWLAGAGSMGRRLLVWWLGELGALVPRRLRAGATDRRSTLLVDLDGERATLRHLVRGTCGEVGMIDARHGPEAARDCVRVLGMLRPAPRVVTLRLPTRDVLRRTLELPEAAGEDLRAVLGFQLDRMTPFTTDEAHFDCRVVGRDSGRLRVELAVAARPRVDAAMRLIEGWGLIVNHVGVTGAAPAEVLPFDLLRGEDAGRQVKRFGRVEAILATSALCLAVAAVVLPLSERHAAVTELEGRVASQRARAERTADLRKEAERLIAERFFLIDRKLDQPPVTEILLEVTRVVPDNSWLAQLRVAKGQIQLTGYSPAATSLLEAIERSTLFQGARFQSTVTSDPTTRLDRFEIVADVVRRAPP